VRAALAGQVFGVGALGMQGIGGDHGPGQVDVIQHVANIGISFVLA
jgi:hypothetical protein